MTFEDCLKHILKFRDDRDWKQFHKPKDMALSLVLEAAELLEFFQWKEGPELAAQLEKKRSEIGSELADLLYWVILMAHDLGIPLEEAFLAKMQQNEKKYPVEKAKGKSGKYSEI